MNTKDDWVAAALSNDILVAELLSRLTQSSSHPPPHPFLRLPCVWGHRQRRSKLRKESAAMTGSPTTPLSWSPSDGDDSNSNSSRPPSDLSRSNKGAYGDGVTDHISSKKKKKRVSCFFMEDQGNLAGLAAEESVLLEEEREDLASMNVTLNQQRVRRQSLLNKFDLNLHHIRSRNIIMEEAPSCPTQHHQHKASSALPDLNMMPSEEEEIPYAPFLPQAETGCAFTYGHARPH